MEIDIEAVLERIIAGDSQAQIARDIGCSPATLSARLNDPSIAERSARARIESAEGWLDKGLEVIASALRKESGIDASAARAYAQECARRAAIRNPAYRDKVQTELTGPGGGPVQVQALSPAVADLAASLRKVGE